MVSSHSTLSLAADVLNPNCRATGVIGVSCFDQFWLMAPSCSSSSAIAVMLDLRCTVGVRGVLGFVNIEDTYS